MSEQPTRTDMDEPIGTETPQSTDDDVTGHGILHEGLQRPPATSRNPDRHSGSGCRVPSREPNTRRGER